MEICLESFDQFNQIRTIYKYRVEQYKCVVCAISFGRTVFINLNCVYVFFLDFHLHIIYFFSHFYFSTCNESYRRIEERWKFMFEKLDRTRSGYYLIVLFVCFKVKNKEDSRQFFVNFWQWDNVLLGDLSRIMWSDLIEIVNICSEKWNIHLIPHILVGSNIVSKFLRGFA